jgi:hypothetical protein
MMRALTIVLLWLATAAVEAQSAAPAPPELPPSSAMRPPEIATVIKRVRVVDVSGDVAYLEPGARDGLRTTQSVVFEKERFFIVAVNDDHVAIALEGRALALGDEGRITVPRDAPPTLGQRRALRSAAAYRGQWPKPALPAQEKPAKPVPLGAFAAIAAKPSRTDVDLSARTTTLVPLSTGDRVAGQSELRGRLRAQPINDVPFAVLADASWLAPWARAYAPAPHPYARVRELELRYGEGRGMLMRAGRMPSPAPMLGELDGARARTAYFGPLAAGAFGGLLPDPVDGRLDDASARFGVDLALDAPEARTRPYASVVVHGTTFEGRIDERKLDVLLGLRPGDVQIHAGGELSLYDDDSELATEPLELSLAHLDTTWHGERVVIGVRGSTYVAERSERLRSLLGVSRVCTTDPGSFECAGVPPRRYAAGAQLSFALGDALWLDTDATYATESSQALDHISGRAGLRWPDPLPPSGTLLASGIALAGSGTHDVYYDHVGLRLTLDARFAPAFDLTLAYGPGLASYASAPRTLVLHEAQLDLAWVIARAWQWVWSSQAQLGDDINALYLGTLIRVHP